MTDPITPETPASITTEGHITGTAALAEPPDSEGAPNHGGVPSDPTEDSTTFSAEYVRRLRAENAEARVRAKIADVANEHLLDAYAGADGRLVDTTVLRLSDDLLGDDGLVDRDKVAEAIGGLITAKPYLQVRKPAPLPGQGLTAPAPTEVGWMAVLRGEAR